MSERLGLGDLARLLPSCEHGVPLRDHCDACSPTAGSRTRETSLSDDLTALGNLARGPVPLHLPPNGRHSAAVLTSKGTWTVTCSGCPAFRVRSRDRHDVETAWGAHRGSP